MAMRVPSRRNAAVDVVVMRLPSGLNAALFTGKPWDRTATCSLPLTSHTRAVSSPPAVTTRVPSGLNDAFITWWV